MDDQGSLFLFLLLIMVKANQEIETLGRVTVLLHQFHDILIKQHTYRVPY